MGVMLFIMASGLTLVFGLMDVLNFGHGAFIAVGAYVATVVYCRWRWRRVRWGSNLAVLAAGAGGGGVVCGALGFVLRAAADRAGLRPASRSKF